MTKKILPGRVLHNVSGHHSNGNCKAVVCSDNGKRWASALDCANELGVSPSAVSWCCTGRSRTCAGLHLHYAYDDIVDPLCNRIQEQEAAMDAQRKELETQRQELNSLRNETFSTNDLIAAAVRKRNNANAHRDNLRSELEAADLECANAEKELNELLARLF